MGGGFGRREVIRLTENSRLTHCGYGAGYQEHGGGKFTVRLADGGDCECATMGYYSRKELPPQRAGPDFAIGMPASKLSIDGLELGG